MVQGRHRQIIAKFTLFRERELFVRKQWKSLSDSPHYVNEQFPKEVAEKRRKLLPKMKKARRDGDKALLAYDTLYVNGRAVKD